MSNFYFWKAERSQKLFMFENKKERFEKIIIEAIEQS
jgi:16S rRNA U1498 N3-methylase RsmE